MNPSQKILVADDEPDVQVMFRQFFRKEIRDGSYSFVFANDGMEALSLLIADPDLSVMVTDLNMPEMDGITLLANVRELNRDLESVVVTAYGDLSNIRLAMNRGAFDFLTKPLDLNDLRITIGKALKAVEEQRRAQHVREMFGRYLSDEVVHTLVDQSPQLKLGGEKREVTIMMSDLRGFSTYTETLPPEEVVEILNTYLGKMTEVITSYNGTIDEFIGDAILTLFGAPFRKDDDPDRAVACAVAMQRAMADVNLALKQHEIPDLEMGIGVNTGEVVVGNIGSSIRAKYGVVGSHVNLTSRIESYSVGGQILISEGTKSALQVPIDTGQAVAVSTKGFSEPVMIHEVLAVGEPYNLSVPKLSREIVPLSNPVPLAVSVMDGKFTTGSVYPGKIVGLSRQTAIIETDAEVAPLDNLKLIVKGQNGPEEKVGDFYAKVTEISASAANQCIIRFTALPSDIGAFLRRQR